MSKKILACFAFIVVLLAAFPLLCGAAAATNVNVIVNNADNNPAVQPLGDYGAIDWKKGIIQAVGYGAPPADAVNAVQARLMTRGAAKVVAQRNLAEAIKGVQVDSQSTVKNYVMQSDVIQTKVSGFLQGARVISEQQLADGSFEVVMEVQLYGQNGLAGAILDVTKPQQIVPLPQPSPDYKPAAVPFAAAGAVNSGLVVDARGLGATTAMAPRVLDETGRVIYGNIYVDPNFQVSHGMVDYAFTAEDLQAVDSGSSRAGASPVIVKAIAVKDGCNVVISKADGDKVLAAAAQGNFLKQCSVVFKL